jgi:uncharacterized protein YjiK
MTLPFDLNRPSKTYKLGKKYRETSGICPIPNADALAFVQDEQIRVHRLDLESGKVRQTDAFHSGDAEDVAIVGRTAYILASGNAPALYRVADYMNRDSQIDRYALELTRDDDPEGLCTDTTGNRLLVACKGSRIPNDRIRKVFAFDLVTQTLDTGSPAFTIDSDALGLKEKVFHPSGISVDPRSGDIYLVGTKDIKLLVRLGPDGKFKSRVKLNKKRFEQPEGVAFSQSGDLFLCSEGKNRKARIFRFKR